MITAMLALLTGRTILSIMVRWFAPSSFADSSKLSGTDANATRSIIRLNVLTAVGSISDHRLFSSPTDFTTK